MSDHDLDYESDSYSDSDEDILKLSLQNSHKIYPLKDTWILYDHTKSNSNTYESSTRKISEFDNVIKFWQIFNNYPNPSKLFNNGINKQILVSEGESKEISSISVFKKGILPKWEDPLNKLGGEVSKRKFNKKNFLEEIDTNWIELLVACVGSMFDKSITGIRVVDSSAPKRNDYNNTVDFKLLYRIELWFDDTSKRQIIEEQFKNILAIEDPSAIYYKEHKI